MNKKVSILIVSVILTVIVFFISTYLQKKLVDYVPTIKCIIVKEDIEAFSKIDVEKIQLVDMPIEIISKTRIVQDLSEIKDLYLKDKIYKGQIILKDQFDTKESLMIYNAEDGKEKIAIKVRNAENGVSYTIRENSLVNVYATLRNEYVLDNFISGDKKYIGNDNDGYYVIKILDSVKVLGAFDENGEVVGNTAERIIDTILIAVTPEEASYINLLREIATFNFTEI